MLNMPPPGQVLPVLLLALLVFAVTLQGLAASGHFPLRNDRAKTAGRPGRGALFGSIGISFLALVAGIITALRLTSWATAVIAVGLSLLFAPLALRIFPDRFVDSTRALIVFVAIALAAAAILIWLAA
jgi:hypothetical protein